MESESEIKQHRLDIIKAIYDSFDIQKSERFNHKYLKKEFINGKWKYYYSELEEKLHKIESEIVKLDYEHIYVFDKNGGGLLNHTDHKIDRTTIPFNKMYLLEGAIYTHNYPGYKKFLNRNSFIAENGSCFSEGDLSIAFSNNLSEIRYVAGKYSYSLKRKDGKNFRQEDRDNYYKSIYLFAPELKHKLNLEEFNVFSKEEKDILLVHAFVRKFVNQFNYNLKIESL